MSIPSNQLELAIKNTALVLTQGRPTVRSTYQVVAPAFDVTVAETQFGQQVARFDEFETCDSLSWRRAQSWFNVVREWHAPRPILGNYSQHDSGLILANWVIVPDNASWKMTHPSSGTFTGGGLPLDGYGRPTLLGRLTAIVARVLPPPTWGFAESNSGEALAVHCIQVQGATSYNVYHDVGDGSFALLGSVPDHTSHSISVPVGYYRVRIAGVAGGIVGIMSNDNPVQVFAAEEAQAAKTTLGERVRGIFTKKGGD